MGSKSMNKIILSKYQEKVSNSLYAFIFLLN